MPWKPWGKDFRPELAIPWQINWRKSGLVNSGERIGKLGVIRP
jgi:hypothetical protein